jgi:undecaprenyl-diphosphatase
MVPVGIVGVFFKDHVNAVFGSGLILVGCMLLLTAALLFFSYYAKPREKSDISFKDAFIIGLAQAIAIFPGLSRSGTTISTGILLGNKKDNVTRFAFLMLIVPVLGEAFLDLIKGNYSYEQSGISTLSLITGFLAAYIFGTIACKWMLNIVRKGKLIYFAYYCIAAALIIFCFSFFNS